MNNGSLRLICKILLSLPPYLFNFYVSQHNNKQPVTLYKPLSFTVVALKLNAGSIF